MKRSLWIGLALGLIALGMVGFGALWAARDQGANEGLVGMQEAQMPSFALPNLQGREVNSSEWQGKVVVVNFWATWCPPCREEMPHFIEAHKELGPQGLAVVAIAIDQQNLVEDFVEVYNIQFPVLMGGVEGMKIAERMGNRFDSLPFTAIYDQQGRAVAAHAGAVSRTQLYEILTPLLQ
jgi:thiol-disulfide isomerase/thioredoxin